LFVRRTNRAGNFSRRLLGIDLVEVQFFKIFLSIFVSKKRKSPQFMGAN